MPYRDSRRASPLAACWMLVLAVGCTGRAERDGPGVPVTGKVLVEGELLRSGSVLYIPDLKKDNRSPVRPAGQIDENGSYTLSAEGKRNIPLGWYLVVVQAFEPVPKDGKVGRSLRVRGRTLVNSTYSRPETSGLRIEVTENAAPEAYNLNLNLNLNR
jgi:hypothetical protein